MRLKIALNFQRMIRSVMSMKKKGITVASVLLGLALCCFSTNSPSSSALRPCPDPDTVRFLSLWVCSFWNLRIEPDGSGHITFVRDRWDAAGAEFSRGTLSISNVLASLRPHFVPVDAATSSSLDIGGPRPDMVVIRSETPDTIPVIYKYLLHSNHVAITRPLFDTVAHSIPTNQTRFHRFYFETEKPWAHNKAVQASDAGASQPDR
jgi:hypothetical protein